MFNTLIELICKLASYGLIHCDFNEFNLLVDDEENVTLIDFPQAKRLSPSKDKGCHGYHHSFIDATSRLLQQKHVEEEGQNTRMWAGRSETHKRRP